MRRRPSLVPTGACCPPGELFENYLSRAGAAIGPRSLLRLRAGILTGWLAVEHDHAAIGVHQAGAEFGMRLCGGDDDDADVLRLERGVAFEQERRDPTDMRRGNRRSGGDLIGVA